MNGIQSEVSYFYSMISEEAKSFCADRFLFQTDTNIEDYQAAFAMVFSFVTIKNYFIKEKLPDSIFTLIKNELINELRKTSHHFSDSPSLLLEEYEDQQKIFDDYLFDYINSQRTPYDLAKYIADISVEFPTMLLQPVEMDEKFLLKFMEKLDKISESTLYIFQKIQLLCNEENTGIPYRDLPATPMNFHKAMIFFFLPAGIVTYLLALADLIWNFQSYFIPDIIMRSALTILLCITWQKLRKYKKIGIKSLNACLVLMFLYEFTYTYLLVSTDYTVNAAKQYISLIPLGILYFLVFWYYQKRRNLFQ